MNKLFAFFALSASLLAAEIFATYEARPLHESKLAFAAVGVLSEVYAHTGDAVKKGAKIAALDDAIEREQIAAATAQMSLAKNALARAKAASGALAASVLDEAQANYDMAAAKLALARAAASQKQLKAPFSGVIADRFAEIGDGVAGPAQPVVLLQDTSKIKLKLSFDVDFLGAIKPGDEFEFRLADGQMARASITAVAPSAQGSDRKVQARAIYSGAGVAAGSFGEGKIITR